MTRALFLDRDGVVNHLVYYESHDEWESPRHVRDLRLIDDAVPALRQVMARGWLVFLITNQPSFAKGKCRIEDLQAVQESVIDELSRSGITITDSFVCYHHPDSKLPGYGRCQCRKPSPYFILEAAKRHDVDLPHSWMAGDSTTDVEAGRKAGCRTALLNYEHSAGKRGGAEPDLICANLAELVRHLD